MGEMNFTKLIMEDQRAKEEAPHYYSFIQRATLDARFIELKALAAPLKSQVAEESGISEAQQGQAPLGSDTAAAQQHHGGVGPGSRSLQILGFCKPTDSWVDETKGKAPNSDSASQRTDQVSHLRCHFPELKSQLALVRYPELPRSPGNHRPNDELKETGQREKEEAPHYYSFIQRATLHARFTELNALVAPLKSQVADESGIDKTEQREEEVPHYCSFIQTAPLVAPLKSHAAKTQQGQAPLGSDTAAAQQQHGGVGRGSRFLQILGFCKPTDSWVDETLEKAPNSDYESQRTDKFTYLRCHFPELKWQLAPELSRSSVIHRHNAEVEETPKLLGGAGPGSRFLQNIGYLEPTGYRETVEDERPSSSEPTPIGPAGGPRTEENLPSNEAGVHETPFGQLLHVVGELQSIVKAMNIRLHQVEKQAGIHEDVVGEMRSITETMNNRLIRVEEAARIREVNPRGMHEETSSAMQPQLDRSVSFSDWLPENRVTGLNEATQERVLQRSFAFHRIDFKLNLEQEAPEGSDPAPPRNDSSQQLPGPSGLMKAPEGSDPSPNDSLQENY